HQPAAGRHPRPGRGREGPRRRRRRCHRHTLRGLPGPDLRPSPHRRRSGRPVLPEGQAGARKLERRGPVVQPAHVSTGHPVSRPCGRFTAAALASPYNRFMLPGPLLVLSAALALQPPEAGSAGLERRKAVLIEQIENAAMAEPPVFGIDTQIRAGEVLKGHDDAHAARFLRDAGQGTLQLTDASTRAALLKSIVKLLAPLDAAHAESLCATQSRRAPGQAADPLAACYDQLIGGLKDWSHARDALDRALAAGAYNLTSTEHLLQQARESQPAEF